MSELVDKLRPEFQDAEYRHAYAEECLNTMIAAQIKVLREDRGMTQKQLADMAGMAQPRIPLLEDASYENWTIRTLKRFAKAFDVALSVKFESFSQLISDFEQMNRKSLGRPTFSEDVHFTQPKIHHKRHRTRIGRRASRRFWNVYYSTPQPQDMELGRKPPKSVGYERLPIPPAAHGFNNEQAGGTLNG
jgi:transcriptional regulator with XRE-family HTH domain